MRTRLVVSIIKTTTSIRESPSVAARISRVIRALGTRLQFSTCARGVRAAVFVRPSDETPTGLELHATRTDNSVSKESGRDDEKSGIRALQTRG
jgi:hypothetical protein